MRAKACLIFSFFFLSFFVSSSSFLIAQSGSPQDKYVPGHVLVKFRPNASRTAVVSAHRAILADDVHAFSSVEGLQLVHLPASVGLSKALAAYRSNPDVLYAEPDYIVRASQTPNDPLFTGMWSLLNTGQNGGAAGADIKATSAWNITTGSSNVVIAVLDTGVDYSHPDLVANIFTGPICPGEWYVMEPMKLQTSFMTATIHLMTTVMALTYRELSEL